VVFNPLRQWLQSFVDRRLYGHRRDAYAAITRLGRQLEAAVRPSEVPHLIVATLADGLRLPYVALELARDQEAQMRVVRGRPTERVDEIPVVYRGELLGRLLVGAGREVSLREADRILLTDVARQAAPLLEGVRLTTALQRSRERLVVAREEERRRLRHDLHDGLGPQLAGLTLGLEAIANVLPADPAGATELVARLSARAGEATASVRAVIDGLRPPALDELGLREAVRERARQFEVPSATWPAGLEIRVDADDLGRLPAAVEVAAYHIALEAVTNAARHAKPSGVTVALRRQREGVEVEVTDDGRGFRESPVAGVGLASMRQRAEELGGHLTVEQATGTGTAVRAWLPAGDQ
jgi:signal transduction histidine kinase